MYTYVRINDHGFVEFKFALRDQDCESVCRVSLRDRHWCVQLYTDYLHLSSTQFVGFCWITISVNIAHWCYWRDAAVFCKISLAGRVFENLPIWWHQSTVTVFVSSKSLWFLMYNYWRIGKEWSAYVEAHCHHSMSHQEEGPLKWEILTGIWGQTRAVACPLTSGKIDVYVVTMECVLLSFIKFEDVSLSR